MNIIWISLYPPLPLNFGGPIGIYHRVKELAKHGNNIYLFYINDDKNVEYNHQLSFFCEEVHSYERVKRIGMRYIIECLRFPYTVAQRDIIQMQENIEECIKQRNIDLINVEFPQMCVNLLSLKKKYHIPIILHEHNNEWNRFSQIAEASKGIKKLLLIRESRKLRRFEKMLENNHIVDYYSFLSTDDREIHMATFNVVNERTILAPLGGDLKEIESIPHEDYIFMFCAAMDSEMNEEAAIWFSQEVFNRIQNENVKLYLVGRNPTERVRALENEKIIVTRTVDSVDEYYALADAVVIPLLHGGGVKVKLFEAVERGKLVITTPVGIEGTLFSSEQMLVADDAEKMLSCCLYAIEYREKCQQLQKSMMDLFINSYTWGAIGNEYNSAIQRLINY